MTVSDPERIIAVEGKADLHIIWHLLKINNPEARKIESGNQSLVMRMPGEKNIRIEIYQERGIDQLCNQVSTRIKKSGLESIGFVFDADGDPKGRWKQVGRRILEVYKEVYPADHSTLKKAFYETPVSEGVWVRDCSLKVGVWMMPNNKSAGTIEDFLSDMVPPENPRWQHAKNYFGTVFAEKKHLLGYKLFPRTKTSKARIHAWLAVQENPGTLPGKAIKSGYFNTKNPKSLLFQKWPENLL